MISKRLIREMKTSQKYVIYNVLFQWIALIANICLMFCASSLIVNVLNRALTVSGIWIIAAIAAISLGVRFACALASSKMSRLSSQSVRQSLREKIYTRLTQFGPAYTEIIPTAKAVQISGEGVDQLENYFGQYLPQFFYAILAPVTLFAILSFLDVRAAGVLLLAVWLIPISIVLVQTFAKRLLSRYWNQYAALGDTFLENLQGLTTLKIFQADQWMNDKMNREAEAFRKITMKVLTMQLNSITIMDLVAYGGAAAGMILALQAFQAGSLSLFGVLAFILLSADFFLPMRLLGSYFHIAMNGMAASDSIFALLDAPLPDDGTLKAPAHPALHIQDLDFDYGDGRKVLEQIDLDIPFGSFVSIIGQSGSGKSTLAGLLCLNLSGPEGKILVNETSLDKILRKDWLDKVTLLGASPFLFKGSIRDNLDIAAPGISDSQMWIALEEVNLDGFIRQSGGLDFALSENGSNLSGGQCQRLALARTLLKPAEILVFDEVTSNVDAQSEEIILKAIQNLAGSHTVIQITHRLHNAIASDQILVLENGKAVEKGTHSSLMKKNGAYARLFNTQLELETYGLDKNTDRTSGQDLTNRHQAEIKAVKEIKTAKAAKEVIEADDEVSKDDRPYYSLDYRSQVYGQGHAKEEAR